MRRPSLSHQCSQCKHTVFVLTMDNAIAASSHRFRHGGCTTRLAFSDSAFSALNISTTTSTCGVRTLLQVNANRVT
jgi:hypothetical protein